MAIITIPGGSDSSIAVTVDGSQAINMANQFREDIENHYNAHDMDIEHFVSTRIASYSSLLRDGETKTHAGIISQGGSYNLKNGFDFLTIGSVAGPGNNFVKDPIDVTSQMTAGRFIRVLAGISNVVTYRANLESGEFSGGSKEGPIHFIGNSTDNQVGDWTITTGNGDDTIEAGNGNNVIDAGEGKNLIKLGKGSNTVIASGQDTITAENSGYNTVTIKGGNTTVNLGDNSVINDVSGNNVMTVGGGSTVYGGNTDTVYFDGQKNFNRNEFLGGSHSTVTAITNNFDVIHGNTNTFDVTGNFKYFNGTGETNVSLTGGDIEGGFSEIYGGRGVNFHLNAHNLKNAYVMLMPGVGGNQTLDGSASSTNLLIYTDTTKGADTQLLGVGGYGNDTLVGGVGSNTLTGGAGDNLFMFNKATDDGGTTLITDFAKSKNNIIELVNYGYDNNDVTRILQNAHDENGNAVLDLGNHKLILGGMKVQDINPNQILPLNFNK